MTNKKISQLPAASAVGSADVLPIVDTVAGETKKATMSQLAESAAELSGGTRTSIPLAIAASTDLSIYVVLGAYALDPADFNSIEFVTLASVTGSGLTGEIQLWNVTDATEVAVNVCAGVLSPEYTSTSVALPSGTKVYEARHKVADGSTSADRINTAWAGLVVASKPNILI